MSIHHGRSVLISSMARFALIFTLLFAVTAAPALGGDADLWATVNVCDTEAHPDEIGIRASMPGGKPKSRLLMRFRVQYRDLSDGRWRAVRDADSGWRRIGRGRKARESGWSFEVAGEGQRILRGVVSYRWMRHGRATRRARRVTEGGHRSTAGADPADFSAATCRIE
jgi:hypothetical protein